METIIAVIAITKIIMVMAIIKVATIIILTIVMRGIPTLNERFITILKPICITTQAQSTTGKTIMDVGWM